MTLPARLLALLIALFLSLPVAHAQDDSVRLESAIDGRVWVLSADLEPPRTARLEDAVMKGVQLYFVLEIELLRSRWYWWDQRVAQASSRVRLSYHTLAREFRVTRDEGLSTLHESFGAALAGVAQVRNWRIDPGEALAPGEYLVQARIRLDATQLPRALQVDALTNRDWNPQVEWTRANFTLPPTPTNAR